MTITLTSTNYDNTWIEGNLNYLRGIHYNAISIFHLENKWLLLLLKCRDTPSPYITLVSSFALLQISNSNKEAVFSNVSCYMLLNIHVFLIAALTFRFVLLYNIKALCSHFPTYSHFSPWPNTTSVKTNRSCNNREDCGWRICSTLIFS